MAAHTVWCPNCRDNRPFSMRHNGGSSWDLCCVACDTVIATFNEGNPFEQAPQVLQAGPRHHQR